MDGTKFKYTYPINGWRDQLLSFNGEECEYNEIGNPTKYRGRSLEWRGRRLISYGKDGKQAMYTYDADSVRTSKVITENGITRATEKYIYDGNTLIAEQRNGEWIYYIYGVDGIAGFRYNDTTYLYRKNIQGDITHIYTQDGVQVAHYAYDAYGNIKELQPESAISQLNPFRYRGYYYDSETDLYYLISRYYDPETGRFISADGIEYLDPETICGLNLYTYCCNNPVMNVDPIGRAWFTILTTAIGTFVGAIVGIVDYFVNSTGGFDPYELIKKTVAGAAAGFTTGLILGLTKGAGIKAASYVSAAVYSAIPEIADYIFGKKDFTSENVGNSLLTIIGETAINGTFNYLANSVAAKMFPTNPGWFVPKYFLSYFTKIYGRRMIMQTLEAGAINNLINIIWRFMKGLG